MSDIALVAISSDHWKGNMFFILLVTIFGTVTCFFMSDLSS